MSGDRFWNLTLSEIWALMDRFEEKERREYIRAGTVAAATYNVNRDTQKHPQPVTHVDVFPNVFPSDRNHEASGAEVDLFFTGIVAKHRGDKGRPTTDDGGSMTDDGRGGRRSAVGGRSRKKVSASTMKED